MKLVSLTKLLLLGMALAFAADLSRGAESAPWKIAEPGYVYSFPRDHHRHADFQTEWWYFTGNLVSGDRRFGYQLTFFRQGLRAPGERSAVHSRFVVDDLKFAHFAITDVGAQRFYFQQKLSRGAFGEAGFDEGERLAWIDDWSCAMNAEGKFTLKAQSTGIAIDLQMQSAKPWVIQGKNGVSQKAAGAGHASHYFSGTRMLTSGVLTLDQKAFPVSGESWLDREWATNQLAPDQIGWNWFSVVLDDGSELMLYQMRRRDGGIDPSSSGTWIAADGAAKHLSQRDYQLTPGSVWTSAKSGGKYPLKWKISVPGEELAIDVETPVSNQELDLSPLAYWEGAIDVRGMRHGKKISGRGYLEMTGYAGALLGLGP